MTPPSPAPEARQRVPLASTPEMRNRIRELATGRDDFDRAVLIVMDDFDRLLEDYETLTAAGLLASPERAADTRDYAAECQRQLKAIRNYAYVACQHGGDWETLARMSDQPCTDAPLTASAPVVPKSIAREIEELQS